MKGDFGLFRPREMPDGENDHETEKPHVLSTMIPAKCPYCRSAQIVKSGRRANKYGSMQLYLCKTCARRFTSLANKNRQFPLSVILNTLTLYNELRSFDEAARVSAQTFGIPVSGKNASQWVADFAKYLPFLRMREYAKDRFEAKDIIERARMFHGQIYDFQYNRAKLELILNEDFRNFRFQPLSDFLELVSAECPHQVFRQSQARASELKDVFNLDKVRITPKPGNAACRTAALVTQAVANNKERHSTLQRFMLANDSVTVAVEVPVLLDAEDLRHFRDRLGFEIPMKTADEDVITGHIDLLQIRNGAVHILDYKPNAGKARPVDQLTLYALALSRLTTLRLFHFKCAWFDEKDYFEFFPLHVVYKKKKSRRRALADSAGEAGRPEKRGSQ